MEVNTVPLLYIDWMRVETYKKHPNLHMCLFVLLKMFLEYNTNSDAMCQELRCEDTKFLGRTKVS